MMRLAAGCIMLETEASKERYSLCLLSAWQQSEWRSLGHSSVTCTDNILVFGHSVWSSLAAICTAILGRSSSSTLEGMQIPLVRRSCQTETTVRTTPEPVQP